MFNFHYRYFVILLLAAYSYLNIRLTAGDKLLQIPMNQYWLFLTLLLVVLGVWELNRVVEKNCERIVENLPWKIHPLIIIFLASLANVTITCIVVLYGMSLVTGDFQLLGKSNLILLFAFGFRVNLFLNCINAIVFFMNKLKTTQLEAEEMKKITAEAQFEALRNQINPHFLFNCFNVLSSLVYKDADTSSQFIAQLSTVYRYLLYTQEKKIVTLREEMEFINAYLFLLKIRFGQNIILERDIPQTVMGFYVAPAVLQMLIENAIKHNVVSKSKPLKVSIGSSGKSIIVTNSLQQKEVKEYSNGIGLLNIQRRYEFLSNEKVIIENDGTTFSVTIPLLQIESV